MACAKRKTSQAQQGLMHVGLYQQPWETVGIDLISLFPETRVAKYTLLLLLEFTDVCKNS